jgi:Ni,Fe-hydrogenase III large subunit
LTEDNIKGEVALGKNIIVKEKDTASRATVRVQWISSSVEFWKIAVESIPHGRIPKH